MKERNEASSQNNEFQNHPRERERIGVWHVKIMVGANTQLLLSTLQIHR